MREAGVASDRKTPVAAEVPVIQSKKVIESLQLALFPTGKELALCNDLS